MYSLGNFFSLTFVLVASIKVLNRYFMFLNEKPLHLILLYPELKGTLISPFNDVQSYVYVW